MKPSFFRRTASARFRNITRRIPSFCTSTGRTTASIMSRPNRRTGLFGGNSNWRGPVWFPVNYLLIESLQRFNYYYGDDFKVEFPTGSGQRMNLGEVAAELSRRLSRIFLRDRERPAAGVRRRRRNSRPIRTSATTSVLRIFSRRQRSRHRRQPSNRLDRAGGEVAAAKRRIAAVVIISSLS